MKNFNQGTQLQKSHLCHIDKSCKKIQTTGYIHNVFKLCIQIYVLFLTSTQLFSQNPSAAYAYASTMLASPAGQTMVSQIESIPNPENPSPTQAHDAAVNHVYSYYVNMYYVNNPYTYVTDPGDDTSACFNYKFLLSAQNDDHLIGYQLWDGTRRNFTNCNINFFSPESTPFMELPYHSYPPKLSSPPQFWFNLNPNDNGDYIPLSGLGFDTTKASFNTFNLIVNEPDIVLPTLLSSRPPTGSRSIRINNHKNEYHINKMSRKFLVNKANSIYFYSSAFVLQNPSGHQNNQPLFTARIINSAGVVVRENCTVSAANNPNTEYVKKGGEFYNYKKWSCDQFDLEPWIGQYVTVEYIVADCGLGAHFGYAYVSDICVPCGGVPDIGIKAIEEKCDPNQVVITGSLKVPTGYVFTDIKLEFYNNGIKRATVPVTTYSLSGGSFVKTLDPTFLASLSPAGGYDVYAVLTYMNPAGETLELRSLSAVPNIPNPANPTVIISDNDFNTTILLNDIYPPCPTEGVMGFMGTPVHCVFSNGLNHEIYRAKMEFNVSALVASGWNLDYLLGFDANHNNVDMAIVGGYFSNTYAFINSSGMLQIDGYIHITDPMQIGLSLLNVYGSVRIKQGCSECDLNFAVWDIIGCGGSNVNCEYMAGENTSLATSVRPIRNGSNQITSYSLGLPIYLPFDNLRECNVTSWTVTAKWYDVSNVAHLLPSNTFNIPSTAPFELLTYLDYSFTPAEWAAITFIELTFTNNCGTRCTTSVSKYGYSNHNARIGDFANNENAIVKMEVSPNPTSEHIKIKLVGETIEGKFEIYDAKGMVKEKSNTTAGIDMEYSIDVSKWVPGTYFIRYTSLTGNLTKNFQVIK